MRHSTRRLSASLLVLALATAACGADTTPTSAPGGQATPGSATTPGGPTPGDQATPAPGVVVPDTCDLLTDDEIATLTGYAVQEVRRDPPDTIHGDACEWELEGTALLVLGITAPGGKRLFEVNLKPFGIEQGDEPLDGIGDDGLASAFNGAAMAIQGDVLVDVQAVLPGPGDVEVAKRVLQRVLANLSR